MRQTVKFFLLILPMICLVACLKRSAENFKPSVHYHLNDALKEENVVPVAIIGSGPAGLSASLYVARAGMKAFVFAGPVPCGQLTQTTFIENWPGRDRVLGMDLMSDIKKQAESFGATVIHDSVMKINFEQWPFAIETEDGKKFKAMAVILATGAQPRKLNIVGESEYWGKGVTTCAVCDAPYFKNKEVVISGGGDSAAEMVFELAPYVKKVTILVRKDAMRAAVAMQKKVFEHPNAVVEYHKEIKAVYGDGQTVTSIDVYDNQTKNTERRTIDGVFLAIGHDPNNQMLQDGIKLDEHGYVLMDGRSQETLTPGVFAAGEIQDPVYRQAIVAAGEGVKAALDATSFLYEIGFNSEIGLKLDKNFFEHFSDIKLELQEITENKELYDLILNAKGLVLLDFYSTDCPGCMQMLPSLEAVASKLADKLTILKTNALKIRTTILRELYYEHDIKVKKTPSLLVFKDGKLLDLNTKIMTKSQLMEYLQKFL
ncbi:FAD-dependent oxidoreductase [Candidatus Babeliales bacterium]|nr:FAD-dependent oxidoreductase [Candidatus Babeliales bacterium]